MQRSRSGDLGEARDIAERIFSYAEATGSVLLHARTSQLWQRMSDSTASRERQTRPDGLTDREVDVVRLVARGLTNAEAGEKLYISPSTVATHVHRILEKTGMANRAELTAYAIRNGLVEA